MFVVPVSDPVIKLVAAAQPLFLNQDLESLHGSVVRVEEEHREGSELGGSVPAVAAVNNNAGFVILNLREDA